MKFTTPEALTIAERVFGSEHEQTELIRKTLHDSERQLAEQQDKEKASQK